MPEHPSSFLRGGSLTSVQRVISNGRDESNSKISGLSFKHWHKYMQSEHERLEKAGEFQGFRQWKWCNKVCVPCRWLDSIDYEKKICHYCFKFKTFKILGTIIIFVCFFYAFLLSLLSELVLPGGTGFYILFMIFVAYITGYLTSFAGLPSMIGHLIVGITFRNIPPNWLPYRDDNTVHDIGIYAELILLVIALIRAGLLLDLSRIKNRILFISRMSIVPFLAELIFACVSAYLILNLPWIWSATLGCILSVVSLASVTSVMEKNRISGYGEDIHLSTVLIAASALNVVFGVIFYSIFRSYLVPKGDSWKIFQNCVIQISSGIAVGGILGLVIAFFPDKRNAEAAVLRILIIGIGSFAIASTFKQLNMLVSSVIACLTFCATAVNMWDELGWHQNNNPVQYFYTLAYYAAQPVVLSLVGFSMNFQHTKIRDLGLSLTVLLIGLAGKESICPLVLAGKSYITTSKEKIFICIAWMSKGSFQALLAVLLLETVRTEITSEEDTDTYLTYTRKVEETIILAILLTNPLVYYSLTLLTPKLLTKKETKSVSRVQDTSDEKPETSTATAQRKSSGLSIDLEQNSQKLKSDI